MCVRAGLLLAGSLCACSLVDPEGSARARLDEARTRWEAVGPSAYHLVEARVCFCGQEFLGPVVLTVTPSGVARVYQASGEPVAPALERFFPTVPGLFNAIEEALHAGVHRVEARYDPATGAPLEIYIDREERAIDEEVRWIVHPPEPIAVSDS